MNLIKVTDDMYKELENQQEISTAQVGYLNYTRNYYLLANGKDRLMTEKPATFIQMNNDLKGESYQVTVLEEEQAEKALKKQPKPRKAPEKKGPAKEEAEPAKENAAVNKDGEKDE